MLNQIEIFVVLVNYHKEQEVKNIAMKFAAMPLFDKVIIVDNDSNCSSKKIFSEIDSNKIVIVFNEENLGYSRGNNMGMRLFPNSGNKRFFVISNSDIEVEENTISKVILELNGMPEFGALAPRMVNVDGSLNGYRTVPMGYEMLWKSVFCLNYEKNNQSKLIIHENGIVEQDHLPGSFFICSEEAMSRCGYFDENVFLYREEEILGKRMNNEGLLLGIDPSVTYKHNHAYLNESLAKHIKVAKQMNASERYFYKEYLKANCLQMIYVSIMLILHSIKESIGFTLRKLKAKRKMIG